MDVILSLLAGAIAVLGLFFVNHIFRRPSEVDVGVRLGDVGNAFEVGAEMSVGRSEIKLDNSMGKSSVTVFVNQASEYVSGDLKRIKALIYGWLDDGARVRLIASHADDVVASEFQNIEARLTKSGVTKLSVCRCHVPANIEPQFNQSVVALVQSASGESELIEYDLNGNEHRSNASTEDGRESVALANEFFNEITPTCSVHEHHHH